MEGEILNYIYRDETVLGIYKSIVEIERVVDNNSTEFRSPRSLLDYISEILENNFISQKYVEEHIREIRIDGMILLGFRIGDWEEAYKGLIFCNFLTELSEKLNSNVSTAGIIYEFETQSILIISADFNKNLEPAEKCTEICETIYKYLSTQIEDSPIIKSCNI